ncbi:unnamed protein product, partial [Rotaria magnacalcarata]
RTVREVRKERERVVASNSIDEEPPTTIPINSIATFPSPSSSSSSSSSIPFTISNDTERSVLSAISIPVPPPMPTSFIQKTTKLIKPDSQTSMNSLLSPTTKAGSPTTANTVPPTTISNTKRSSSKTSVFSKIFK